MTVGKLELREGRAKKASRTLSRRHSEEKDKKTSEPAENREREINPRTRGEKATKEVRGTVRKKATKGSMSWGNSNKEGSNASEGV